MKKIKLYIPALREKAFEFYFFDFSLRNNTKSQILLKYLYFFGYIFFFLSILAVPFANYIFPSLDGDSAVLKLLLILIPVNLGIFLAVVLMNGRRRLIDPVFFLTSLIFALGTTTSTVLTSNPSLTNTFGSIQLRALAGVSIILLITTYYLSGIYIHNRELFRRAFKSLLFGIFIFFTLAVLNQNGISGLESVTLMIFELGGIFVLMKSSSDQRILKALLALILVIIGFLGYKDGQLSPSTFNYLLFPSVISLIVVLMTLFFSKKNFVKTLVANTKIVAAEIVYQKKLRVLDFFKYLFDWLLVISPVILIIVIIIFERENPTIWNSVKVLLEGNLKAFNTIADFTKNIQLSSMGTFLFGIGSANLSIANTFIQNIIVSQGFLGLVSYLFLWTYGIVAAVRFVYSNFKKGGNYMLPSFLTFVLVFIPIEAFFFNVGFKLIWIWWIAFAFVSIKYGLKNKQNIAKLSDGDFEVVNFTLFGRKLPRFVKYLIVLLTLIIATYIAITFTKVSGI